MAIYLAKMSIYLPSVSIICSIACISPLSLYVCRLCLCVTLYRSCKPVFGRGVDVCRLSLTCLRLHREIRLSLQYTVHQPGTVAVGGVISICSCHLHHWRTYSTDTQTWQTSQDMALYLSASVQKWFDKQAFCGAFADSPACTGSDEEHSPSEAGLPYYFSAIHHCRVKTSTLHWFSCFKYYVSSMRWQSSTAHGFMKPFQHPSDNLKKDVVKLTKHGSL